MKSLNSKLFAKFELKNSDLKGIVGGQYTAVDTDTNNSNGSNDIAIETNLGDGQTVMDVTNTNPAGGSRDKPKLTQV